MSQGAAALHVFSEHAIGVGLGTGLIPDSPRMTVTKATGNVVHEIDHRPAFQIYQAYAEKRGVKLDAHSAGRFLLEHELGVYFFDELRLAPLRSASASMDRSHVRRPSLKARSSASSMATRQALSMLHVARPKRPRPT